MAAADAVREIAKRVQHMSDEELREAYLEVRRSPLTPSNHEYARRVESEFHTRRLIRERDESDQRERDEMQTKVEAANAGTPTLDQIAERASAREEER